MTFGPGIRLPDSEVHSPRLVFPLNPKYFGKTF